MLGSCSGELAMGKLEAMTHDQRWDKHSEGAAYQDETPPVEEEAELSSDESTSSSSSSASTEHRQKQPRTIIN